MSRLSDKHYAVIDCTVRSLGRMVLGAVVARSAGPQGFSIFVLLITTEVIFSTLASAFYALPMLTMGPGLPTEQRAPFEHFVLQRITRTTTILGTGGLVVVPLFAGALEVATLTLALFVLATVGGILATGSRTLRQARFDSKRTVEADILAMLLPILVLLLFRPGDTVLLPLVWGSVALGQAIAWRWMSPRTPTGLAAPRPDTMARFRALGPPIATGSALNSLATRSHPYLLGAIAGSMPLSMLGAAVSLVGPIRLLSGALSAVLRPRLALHHATTDTSAARRALQTSLGLQLACGAVAILGSLMLGEFAATAVFGAGFAGVAQLLPIAVLFATLEGIGASLTVDVQAKSTDGPRRSVRARLTGGCVSLGLVPLLCPLLGAIGTLWALVAGEIAYLAHLSLQNHTTSRQVQTSV